MWFSLISLLLASSGISHAYEGFIVSPTAGRAPVPTGVSYVIPNETYPQHALKLFNEAPSRVYLSVGSERGFMSAAASPKVSHLLLVDFDTRVVDFNLYNTLLLKMSQDRQEFVNFRTEPTLQKLDRLLERERSLSLEDRNFLKRNYQSFSAIVQQREMKNFHLKPGIFDEFRGTHYLHDEKLFQKLQLMARKNNISAIQGDLTDLSLAESLRTQLAKRHLKLSVIDISNSLHGHAPCPKVAKFLDALDLTLPNDAYLLTTKMASTPKNVQRPSSGLSWKYHAYQMSYLRSDSPKSVGTMLEHALNHELSEQSTDLKVDIIRGPDPVLAACPTTEFLQKVFYR